MMKEFAIVGRPNSGKTLFTLNFADYLNCKTVDITFRACDGSVNCRHYSVGEAKRDLCSPQQHKTRTVQSMILKIPVGKTTTNFKLTDTCGIAEQIHKEEAIRRGMAQTLSLLRSTDFIIHIIDLTTATASYLQSDANLDREIYNYGIARNRYVLLANKIDIPAARDNLASLSGEFNQAALIPISALYNQGFQAVKSYVAGNV